MELINIDEADYLYDPDCLACHDAGKAPHSVYISVSNILRGDNWVPGDKDPPNGIFKCPSSNVCEWSFLSVDYLLIYDTTAPNSTLLIFAQFPIPAFNDAIAQACKFNFKNAIVAPAGRKFYGGQALVSWVEPPKQNSLAELCELLNIPTDGLTDCLIYPVGASSQVVNMLRGTDQTKILIKRDFA